MRAATLVISILATSLAFGNAQTSDVEEAIRSALKWHYRWIEPVPSELRSIECSVAMFEGQSFALCKPVALSLNIETQQNESPRVAYMGHEFSSFDVALATFRRNINPKGKSLGPVRPISFVTEDLRGCTINWQKTVHAPEVVLTMQVRKGLLSSGKTLHYPVICEGDPFYLLFCLTGERILWIWLYEILGDQFELRWSFDAGTQQRKPPPQAIENLRRKALWYTVEGRKNGVD